MYVFGPLELAQLEESASDPAAFNVQGRIYYNTGDKTTRVYNGSAYKHLVVTDLAQTLILKTIDADSNTLSNIVNANIKAAAGIVYSKLNLTGGIVNADVSGSAAITYAKLNLSGGIVNADVNASAAIVYSKLNLSGGIVNADVNATAAIVYSKLSLGNSIAFSDLSSSTCTIDEDSFVTDSAVRVPTQQSVKAYVDAQIATVTSASDSVGDAKNLALATSVASNELTIALKTKAGSDPSVGSPVTIGYRNATAATGTYTVVTTTGALSIVVPDTATLGHASAVSEFIYVYSINNAGANELAISSSRYDTGSIVSTTVLNTSSDSLTAIYSTTARANVPLHLIGRILITEATAGTWASNAIEVTPGDNFPLPPPVHYVSVAGSQGINGRGTTDTNVHRFGAGGIIEVGTAITRTDSATAGTTFTINRPGLYVMDYSVRNDSSAVDYYITKNSNTIGSIMGVDQLACATCASTTFVSLSATSWLAPGDVIRCTSDVAGANNTGNRVGFKITKIA